MLVYQHPAAEELAQQYEGRILKESHAVAGDSQIAQVVATGEQLPEEAKVGSDEAQDLLHAPLPYLVHASRGREVHEVAVILLLYQLAILDILAHHGRPMHRRRQWRDKEYFHVCLVFRV